jgi:hypothetical protein
MSHQYILLFRYTIPRNTVLLEYQILTVKNTRKFTIMFIKMLLGQILERRNQTEISFCSSRFILVIFSHLSLDLIILNAKLKEIMKLRSVQFLHPHITVRLEDAILLAAIPVSRVSR